MGGQHSHDGQGRNMRSLGIAALLTGSFMVIEVAGGLMTNSLALIADAAHMLTDFGSLVLAWYGFRLARRPADWRHTYGFDRFSVLTSFVNGLTLIFIAVWITVEAVGRIEQPAPVLGGPMLAVAVAGLVINIVALLIVRSGDRENLNIRGAALHVLGDLLGSVGAIAAAVVILTTGWTYADPLVSVLVAVILLQGAWQVVRDAGRILLEAAPQDLDVRTVAEELQAAFDGIEVSHTHAWSLTQERRLITLEVAVPRDRDGEQVRDGVKRLLHDRFNLSHATVELRYRD
ncbi:MAG: cation diffusion facilitator family transporter [Alphaproteobacteria bacterium]|nr:cation diffusion facilitator family transporter [Alphaproteobacteria bacterium]